MIAHMKAIQITMDEELLAELDASEEVRREGRSAVLRKAAAEYLARRRANEIAEAYARAYGETPGLGEEFSGWEKEGRWPER
jgi:metal-responsive CopG/Arc/MetJ family transcriptional regulator